MMKIFFALLFLACYLPAMAGVTQQHQAILAMYAAGAGPDVTAPEVSSATINDTAVVINFTEAVSQGTNYLDSYWNIDGTTMGADVGLAYVSGNGTSSWTMTAATAAIYGETVDLDFVPGATTDIVEDAVGNDLAAITSAAVTNNTPAVESCSSAPSSMVFNWHMEDTTVTSGTPAGCSVGDTTAAATGAPSLSATSPLDGTYSALFDASTEYYTFAVASGGDIVFPNAGTLVFDFNMSSLLDGVIVRYIVDASNKIYVWVNESAGVANMIIYHVAGGVTRSKEIVTSLTANTTYTLISKWSVAGVSGNYLYIKCNAVEGNGTTALGTFTDGVGTFDIGRASTGPNVKIDNLQVYNYWVTGDPR